MWGLRSPTSDRIHVSRIVSHVLNHWATGEAQIPGTQDLIYLGATPKVCFQGKRVC